MRVVIDCNIIIAAARIDGSCRRALLAAIRDHEIVLSEPIVDEYRDVGARLKHRAYRPVMLVLVDLLEIVALTVEPAAIDCNL
jgi:predicted nucleic acid-binding protein